jgi:hypothetical protein
MEILDCCQTPSLSTNFFPTTTLEIHAHKSNSSPRKIKEFDASSAFRVF